MKFMKTLISSLIALFVLSGFVPAEVSEPIEKWDIFELELKGPADGNPYMEVRLSATFSNGITQKEVAGFYDGDGVYRIRFMPEQEGEWTYATRSNRRPLSNRQGAFEVVPPSGNNRGPVGVRDKFHFGYADGTRFVPVGTTAYSWLHRPKELREQTLKTLAGAPFNKLRMLLHSEDHKGRSVPELFPYPTSDPLARDWDTSQFNPEFFRHVEVHLHQLQDLGIEADIILFHSYGDDWGFAELTAEEDDRYLRYVMARFSAFRNVWWSVANEWDFVHTKTQEDWDRYFQIIHENDPYGHLLSIHNGFHLYDYRKPWITHASIQNGAAVEESGRAQLYRDVWEKPVIYDEAKYEGDLQQRWGQLSAEELVHRFWSGAVAGTYVSHGEAYNHPSREIWLSTGGVLRGQSPDRIAFLRNLLEESPGPIDPVDKWQDTRTGGVPGEYYLIYFGREAPTSWAFSLPRRGLADGQEFVVEVIDTWNMTISPVEGSFVAEREDRYRFRDRANRSVELPGRPYLALRIRKVGGESVFSIEEPPEM